MTRLGVAHAPLKKGRSFLLQGTGRQNRADLWTPEEHERFVFAFTQYGRKWRKVAEYVRTKTREQTKTHGRSYVKQLEREGKAVPPLEKAGATDLHWTPEEEERLVAGLRIHGRRWKKVAKHVGTKTHQQTKSKGEYNLKQLELAAEKTFTPEKIEKGRKAAKVPMPKKKILGPKEQCVSHTAAWTAEEHERLVEGIKLFGQSWETLAAYVGTKTRAQTKNRGQHYLKKLEEEGKVIPLTPTGTKDVDVDSTRRIFKALVHLIHTTTCANDSGWPRASIYPNLIA